MLLFRVLFKSTAILFYLYIIEYIQFYCYNFFYIHILKIDRSDDLQVNLMILTYEIMVMCHKHMSIY